MRAEGNSATKAQRPRGAAEAARLLAQQSLRDIVERLADGIVIVDGDGTIRFANPAAETLFGRPAAELVGEDFGHPLVPGDIPIYGYIYDVKTGRLVEVPEATRAGAAA